MDPANDEPHAALDQLSEFIARREAEAAAALIEARAGSGKEPFSIEALQAAYNL